MMILKFLKASPRKGLLLKKGPTLDILACSDVNYEGSIDGRKSTT